MDSQKVYDICIVGSAGFDYFFEVVDLPQRGETIAAKNCFTAPGGKGANQAVAVAKLLGESIFAGQLGVDENGDTIAKQMKDAGCTMEYCRRLQGVKTAIAFIALTESGQNSIIIVGGANTHYDDLTKLPKEYTDAIDRSKILLLQREIPNEINTLAAKCARSKGKLVALDVGGRDEPFPEELLQNLDIISPNETEIERLIGVVGDRKIEEVIKEKLFSKYPNMKVFLKLGADGCAFVTQDKFIKCGNITTFNQKILEDYKIVDVTGAGDCLTGSFFVRYSQLEGKVPEEELYERCMRYGNLCAFLCITQKGCIPAMPTAKAVEEFHKKYFPDLLI